MVKRRTIRWGREVWLIVAAVVLLAGLGLGVYQGMASLDREAPTVVLTPETTWVGPKNEFTLKAADHGRGLREVKVIFSQGGQDKLILEKTFPAGKDKVMVTELPFILEPRALGFQEGKGTLLVSARDHSWRHWFQGHLTQLRREVNIDLVPLTLSLVSLSHLLHAGGTGCLTYHLNKEAKESGIQVGETFYPGYPNPRGPKGDYVVLFPLPQEVSGTVMAELMARPAGGEVVRQPLTLKVRPRRWRQDTMNLTEPFLRQVAAAFPVSQPGNLLAAYLEVNRDIRRANHDKVRQLCRHSHPQPLWAGGFLRYEGKPMARFGDRRTYIWQGQAVDRQIHLGEDLANLLNTPVPAANNGIVVLAEPLGIYGQTVILDHGLGVFSMYSHLSQMAVKVGDTVTKGQIIGKTGTTGLAGGDHLHFSMLVSGEFVDPLEWWDPHWLKDQVEGVWVKSSPTTALTTSEAGRTARAKGRPGKTKKKR